MKTFIILILVIFCAVTKAEIKDVLLKVPKRFDTVLKLNLKGLKKVQPVVNLLKIIPENKDPLTQLKKFTGLNAENIKTLYLCGNLKQMFDENGSPLSEHKIEKLFTEGLFDLLIFAELNKPLDSAELAKTMPKSSKLMTSENTKYFKLSNKDFINVNIILFKKQLIGLAPDFALKDLLSKEKTDTILQNEKTVELFKENGFGGLISILHSEKIIKVPEMTPWLKEYQGAVLNTWYTEESEVQIELTVNFETVQAVKNAYTLTTLGMNFLDSKPNLKAFKSGIKIKVQKNNLLIDIKIKPKVFLNIIKDTQNYMLIARGKAFRAKSMSHLKQLSSGIISYASDNKGKMPDNLNNIAQYVGGKETLRDLLICPVTGRQYVYKKAVENYKDAKRPSDTAILISETDDGTFTAFLDGHITFSKNQNE